MLINLLSLIGEAPHRSAVPLCTNIHFQQTLRRVILRSCSDRNYNSPVRKCVHANLPIVILSQRCQKCLTATITKWLQNHDSWQFKVNKTQYYH